jgi:4-hydroxybenzoyl-CoA thioesterase
VTEWRSKSFVQQHRIWRGEDLLVEGTEVRVFVGRGEGGTGIRGVVVPDEVRALA